MPITRFLQIALLMVSAFDAAGPLGAQGVDVLTHRGYTGSGVDPNARAGVNLNEKQLKKSNVKKGSFGKLVFREVDGNVYAQPLIVTQTQTAGGLRDLVIVATEHNSVYAIDAGDINRNSTSAVIWHKDESVFGTHLEHTEVAAAIGADVCNDLTTEVGITSTPVIQLNPSPPKDGRIFVVAKSKQNGNHVYKLFALRLSDGQKLSETNIEGEAKGSGFGSNGGMISFRPRVQLNRSALLLRDNILYIAFGGHCDKPKGTEDSYHGWLFAYNVSNPAAPVRIAVLCTTPNGRGSPDEGRAGIWMSGFGPSVDDQGRIYLVTGDGTDSAQDFGNSVLQVKVENNQIAVKDWFSPQDAAKREQLKVEDVDLGSSGAVPIPGTHLLLAGGKEGRMYLIDGDDMGHGAKTSIDSFQVTHPKDRRYYNIHGAPVVWPRGNEKLVYINGEEDPLKQYKLVKDNAAPGGWKIASPKPRNAFGDLDPFKTSCRHPGTVDCISAPFPNFPFGLFGQQNRDDVWMPGGFLTLSADGTNNGIVWLTMPFGQNLNMLVGRGVLRAFDASDVSNQLWDSESTGDPHNQLGQFAKFNPPVVANGRVYVATFQQEEILPGGHHKKDMNPNADRPALAIYGPK